MSAVQLSFVIPVFNGARSISNVVREIRDLYPDLSIEIVLVNDGSSDDSEQVCRDLQSRFPDTLTFVHLAKNFGEHSAVLAGLNHCRGDCVAVLDDDGQNPPAEVRTMYDYLCEHDHDVVYGKYKVKMHSWFRNLGSRFNDRVANVMLGKPPGLYLSSFKVMNRFLVDQIVGYAGAFPYIDGLILRATSNIGQVEVEHKVEQTGRSNYNLRKLFRLWLNMFLNFSILPLRAAVFLGLLASAFSLVLLVAITIDKFFISPDVPHGVPTILATVVLFSGVQLVVVGMVGEYVGRLFLDHSRAPQFVVRYVKGVSDKAGASGWLRSREPSASKPRQGASG